MIYICDDFIIRGQKNLHPDFFTRIDKYFKNNKEGEGENNDNFIIKK